MPVTRPDRANVEPTDLGTKSIVEVSAALDQVKGPPSKEGRIRPDTFSKLTNDERVVASLEGRQVANDRFVALRVIAKNLATILAIDKLIRWIATNFQFDAVNAKRISRLIIAVTLYRRWGAWEKMGKVSPQGVRVLPFLGAVLDVAKNKHIMHDFFLSVACKTGFQTFEVPIPMSCAVFVMDARDREYILKTNPWNFLKNRAEDPASFERVFAELLGRGIFSTDGSEWLGARKIASHMFSGTALRTQMEDVFNHHADRVVRLLKSSKAPVVDMQEVFQCAVFDAFCEIAFGVIPNATDSAIEGVKPSFLVSFDAAQQIAAGRIVSPPLTWNLNRIFGMLTGMGEEAALIHHIQVINDYIFSIIDQRLNETDLSAKNDLLSLYIQYSRAQSQPFSREDYRDIIANFMIAGRDTTSCTLTYATKFLGENPEEYKRLREEGLFDLGKSTMNGEHGERTISWEESRSIPYADAVVNEVLRLAPPVGNDVRICVSDDVLPSGLRVRDGSRMGILNQAIGLDPFLWSEPKAFKPERWIKYNSQGVPQPVKRVDEYVHPIFFAGRRLCLGKDMARFEAIVFMSKIFDELRVEPLPLTNTSMVPGPVIFLQAGLKCKIQSLK